MTVTGEDRWARARRQLVGRWRRILERIEARDEGGVLELSNAMDEFCDEAGALRDAAAIRDAEEVERGFEVTGAARLSGTRCRFCRGFVEIGGCLGMLGDMNKAVLGGCWDVARQLAEEYIARLESLEIGGPAA